MQFKTVLSCLWQCWTQGADRHEGLKDKEKLICFKKTTIQKADVAAKLT